MTKKALEHFLFYKKWFVLFRIVHFWSHKIKISCTFIHLAFCSTPCMQQTMSCVWELQATRSKLFCKLVMQWLINYCWLSAISFSTTQVILQKLSACMKKTWLKLWVSVRRSAVREFWWLSWLQWQFTGRKLSTEHTETQGEWARGADVPYLLSFLVRAWVRTVMCMSVYVTSGLQGTLAWGSPDPGGWHRGVKSGDVVGKEGGAPRREVATGWTKTHCECLDFSVCCQTSNYKLFLN